MLRCIPCNGTKFIKPLGNIEKRCPVCDGVGYTIPSEPSVIIFDSEPKPEVFNKPIAKLKESKDPKKALEQRLSKARSKSKAKEIV